MAIGNLCSLLGEKSVDALLPVRPIGRDPPTLKAFGGKADHISGACFQNQLAEVQKLLVLLGRLRLMMMRVHGTLQVLRGQLAEATCQDLLSPCIP